MKVAHEYPNYIFYIEEAINKNQDNKISLRTIDKVISLLVEYIKYHVIVEGEEVHIIGLGTFQKEYRPINKQKRNWFFTFTVNPAIMRHLREYHGTASPKKLKEIEERRKITREIWNARLNYQGSKNAVPLTRLKEKEEIENYDNILYDT
jgi:hypothetical protein